MADKAVDKGMRTVILRISGMSCAACAARIEKGINKLTGVKGASVNLAAEKASVTYDPAAIGDRKSVV